MDRKKLSEFTDDEIYREVERRREAAIKARRLTSLAVLDLINQALNKSRDGALWNILRKATMDNDNDSGEIVLETRHDGIDQSWILSAKDIREVE